MHQLNFTPCLLLVVSITTFCHGLTCFRGTSIERTQVTCGGCCLTVRKNGSFYYCSPLKIQTGCQNFNVTEAYFCNTDLCNHENHFPCKFAGHRQDNRVKTLKMFGLN